MADNLSDEDRIREVRRQALQGIRRLSQKGVKADSTATKPLPLAPLETQPGRWTDIGESRLASRVARRRARQGGTV